MKRAVLLFIINILCISLCACGECKHEFTTPTCTTASTCTKCGITSGNPLGHEWKEANCTEPKTCTRCGMTDGQALGHTVENWKVTREATFTESGTEEGVCSVCGEIVEADIEDTTIKDLAAITYARITNTKEEETMHDADRELLTEFLYEANEKELAKFSEEWLNGTVADSFFYAIEEEYTINTHEQVTLSLLQDSKMYLRNPPYGATDTFVTVDEAVKIYGFDFIGQALTVQLEGIYPGTIFMETSTNGLRCRHIIHIVDAE